MAVMHAHHPLRPPRQRGAGHACEHHCATMPEPQAVPVNLGVYAAAERGGASAVPCQDKDKDKEYTRLLGFPPQPTTWGRAVCAPTRRDQAPVAHYIPCRQLIPHEPASYPASRKQALNGNLCAATHTCQNLLTTFCPG